MKIQAAAIGLLGVLVIIAVFSGRAVAEEIVPRISQQQLLEVLGDPDLAILDARLANDWRKSDRKVKGAVRIDPHDVGSWIKNYTPDQKIVLYCA